LNTIRSTIIINICPYDLKVSNLIWLSRLVSGGGDIKITKDGNVLLKEMVSNKKDYSAANLVAKTENDL
jgi:hypothetical protein